MGKDINNDDIFEKNIDESTGVFSKPFQVNNGGDCSW